MSLKPTIGASRTTVLRGVLFVAIIFALTLLYGCVEYFGHDFSPNPQRNTPTNNPTTTIKIGTLPLEDLLPIWVAQDEGLFKDSGINIEYITFQSAQEQIAAMTAGEIDAMTADLVMLAMLNAGGTPVKAVAAIQGAPSGIVASPKATQLERVEDLRGVAVAASSATCIEYIIDKTLGDAGVAPQDIKIEEIKKIPVRHEMLMNNKVMAAALPWPFYAMAESAGAKPLAGYSTTSHYSSEVLAFSDNFLAQENAKETIDELLAIWGKSVTLINANPASYEPLLVLKARLPENLPANYEIHPFPAPRLPKREMVQSIVEWALGKGYLNEPLTYETLVWVQ